VENLTRDRSQEARLTALGLRPGIGVDRAEDSVERGIGPGRDGQLQPTADQQVGRAGSLGEQDRILVAHRDHGGAQRDAPRVLTGRGEERQRRGQVVVEMSLVRPA
jgi:hypothetical protein